MEAGTLLASTWSWSLKMGPKAAGPCAGSMEVSARELHGIGAAAINGRLRFDQD